MSQSSKIAWTDATWNPVVGCQKISEGCRFCYAKTLHDQRHKAHREGKKVPEQYARPFEVVQLMPDRLTEPLSWRKPRKVFVNSTFEVLARRTDAHGAREVNLPYFVTVLRGGSAVVSKRIGTVTVNFADGQERAQATGQGSAYIDRAAATLPADIRERITRKRKAGEADAAIDPLSEPDVKAAVQRATFELLLGFQLDQEQLAYNATR